MQVSEVKHSHAAVTLFTSLGLQVNRETKTDCALAELYTKSTAVEQMLQEQKKADVFTKLYIRMNEVSGFMLKPS